MISYWLALWTYCHIPAHIIGSRADRALERYLFGKTPQQEEN